MAPTSSYVWWAESSLERLRCPDVPSDGLSGGFGPGDAVLVLVVGVELTTVAVLASVIVTEVLEHLLIPFVVTPQAWLPMPCDRGGGS